MSLFQIYRVFSLPESDKITVFLSSHKPLQYTLPALLNLQPSSFLKVALHNSNCQVQSEIALHELNQIKAEQSEVHEKISSSDENMEIASKEEEKESHQISLH